MDNNQLTLNISRLQFGRFCQVNSFFLLELTTLLRVLKRGMRSRMILRVPEDEIRFVQVNHSIINIFYGIGRAWEGLLWRLGIKVRIGGEQVIFIAIMNLRENGAMEGEEGRNGLKQSQLKAKRRGVPVDRERLYEENQELRGRLRELQEANLRLKTQVAVAEKEKEELFNMAEEQVFHPRPPQRSQSGAHKMSAGPPEGRSNFTLLKEKQSSAFKKLLRDRQNQNEKLRIENQNIKKTMKFTRLSQLVTENNELGEETRRLRFQLLEARNETDQFAAEYSARIDMLRKELQQEKDGEKRNGVELKRQQETNNELKEKLRDCELRKVEVEKRLGREIKALKAENQELRLKVNNEAVGKDCDKPECLKNRKEKADLKKKTEQQEKEIKNLQASLHAERSKLIEKQLQLRSQTQASKQSKRPSQPKTNSAIVPQKKEEETAPRQPSTPQKVEVVEPVPSFKSEISQPQKQKVEDKPKSSIIEEKPKKSKVQTDKSDVLQAVQIKPIPAELAPKPASTQKKPEETVESKPKEKQHNDSYDTDKLLESYESSHENVDTKPAEQEPKKESKKIEDEKYKESDGEYEQIDFDQEEPKKAVKEQPKPKEKLQQKKTKTKDKKDKEKQREKQVAKPKSKSTKKLQSDEEVLYDGRKDQEEDGKAELKIIRETLTYKFMAQGYSYQQFANYIKQSKKKSFGVEDIMSILSEEPFLLGEEHVQGVIIYLFETNNLTGDEVLSSKIFAKKMKKFLGKAKPLDEETEKEYISQLITLIQADQRGKRKIRKQCQKNDSGDGTITREAFLTILKGAGVQEELLETALSQITYTSVDINHLNYDVFIKRFNEAE